MFGDIEDLKECFERYPNSQSWLKELLHVVWINYVLNNWIMLNLYSLYCFFVSDHITIHWNLTRTSVKECFKKPYTHTQTQPQHHHLIGLDMAYTSTIYMQTFCKLIGYRAGLSLSFEVEICKKYCSRGIYSCSGLVNNLFFCQRSQGANLEFPGEIPGPALNDSPERAC